MKVPYHQPATLSDPYHDWSGSEERIAAILAKAPAELDDSDYWMIFYGYLPAANYREGCFYVPYFLTFYRTTAQIRRSEHEGFFWFIDHFREDFERDGLIEPILEEVWDIFLSLTSSFSVQRLTDEELAAMGISPAYRELCPHAGIVDELMEAFTSWPVFEPLLQRLKDYFADPGSIDHSMWYAECAIHTRDITWLQYGGASGLEPELRRRELTDYFHEESRYSLHLKAGVLNDGSPYAEFRQYRTRVTPTEDQNGQSGS